MMEDRILIVDDDREIRYLFKSFFENIEYIVETAESAEEALKKLEQNHFQLIFLDLNLPDMSGIELCAFIRQSNPVSTITAITGYGRYITGRYARMPVLTTILKNRSDWTGLYN